MVSFVLLVAVAGGGFALFKNMGKKSGQQAMVEPADSGPASEPSAPNSDPMPASKPAASLPGGMAKAGPAPASAGGFGGNNSWPQWRGPNRDGKSTETGLLKEWLPAGPPLLWKIRGLGKGFSTVSVAGGRVYTMGELNDGSHLHCFDEKSGNKIWSSDVIGNKGGDFVGPKSTPTIDGDRVYCLGQFGDFVCFDAQSGQEVWRKHLMNDFGGKYENWNYTESPLIDGDKVFASPGGRRGYMVALNKGSGATLWQSRQWTDSSQYVSPILAEIGGRRQVIQLSQQSLVALDVNNGQIIWRVPRRGATAVIPTPVVYNNIVFVTSGYNIGCNAFQINSQGGRYTSRQLYANKEIINHHGGVILIDKYVYGHSDRGGWTCLDVTTGQTMWKETGVGKGAVVYADGHLYTRSESGSSNVALVDATPSGYVEKGRFSQPDRSGAQTWPHPVVVNGKLFLRDQDMLLCYDVRAK